MMRDRSSVGLLVQGGHLMTMIFRIRNETNGQPNLGGLVLVADGQLPREQQRRLIFDQTFDWSNLADGGGTGS